MDNTHTPENLKYGDNAIWQMLRISLSREYDYNLLEVFLASEIHQLTIYRLVQEYINIRAKDRIRNYISVSFTQIRDNLCQDNSPSFSTVSPIGKNIPVNTDICAAFISEVSRGLDMEEQEVLADALLTDIYLVSPRTTLIRLIGLSLMDFRDKVQKGLYPESLVNTLTSELILYTYTLIGNYFMLTPWKIVSDIYCTDRRWKE